MKRLRRQLNQPGHGETMGNLLHRLTHLPVGLLITEIREHLNDELSNAPYLIRAEAARGYRRGAQSDTAGKLGRATIEGDDIPIDRDPHRVQGFLRLLAS